MADDHLADALQLDFDRDGCPWENIAAVSDHLATAASLEQVSQILVHVARRLVAADGVTFVLREGDSCVYLEENAIGPLWRGLRFPLQSCISGWCMLHGQTAEVPDITKDPRIPHDVYAPTFVKSLVMTPVGIAPPIAAMGCYWSTLTDPNPRTRRIVEALARCAGSALYRLVLENCISEYRERMMVALEEGELGFWQLDVGELALTTSMTFRDEFDRGSDVAFSYASLLEHLYPEDRDRFQRELKRLVANGGQFEMMVRIMNKEDEVGRALQIRAYSEPSLDLPAQRVMGFSKRIA